MARLDTIHVLHEFYPFLTILQTYNIENYRELKWLHILRNICFAFVVSSLIISNANTIFLATWYLLENRDTIGPVVVNAPILLTITAFFITIVELSIKNRMIAEVIIRLQKTVEKSEFYQRPIKSASIYRT